MTKSRRAPGPLTRLLARIFSSRPVEELSGSERRAVYGLIGGYVSIVVNVALFAVKLVFGVLSGSIALIADAAHTAADSVTSAIVIVSAYIARRPADAEHPFGHGRSEAIASVMIAVLLGVTAFEFGKTSVERLLCPRPVQASWLIIGVISGTIVIKEWLARYARRLALESGNAALEADFWHHRSDVIATALVVGGIVASRYGLHYLDGVAGMAVSLLIAKVAVDIARSASSTLLGPAPDPAEIQAVREKALAVEGVRGVHDIVLHHYGDVVFISLHVETSAKLTADELHQVAAQVEKAVARAGHGSVCVHVDPINPDHPAYERVRQVVAEMVERDRELRSFHDLRLVGGPDEFGIVVDIRTADCCGDLRRARRRVEAALRDRLPGTTMVVVELEPPYVQ